MFNKVAEYHRNPWPSIDRNMYCRNIFLITVTY